MLCKTAIASLSAVNDNSNFYTSQIQLKMVRQRLQEVFLRNLTVCLRYGGINGILIGLNELYVFTYKINPGSVRILGNGKVIEFMDP